MTNPSPSPGHRQPGGADWHVSQGLLAGYAAGDARGSAAWSVEAHLTGCARCRSALSARADAERLARNRSVLLVRAAVGEGSRLRRAAGRLGLPDHVLGLLAATPSLRRSWLLSVTGVLAVTAGEAAAAGYAGVPGGAPRGMPGHPGPEALVPFLLVAPLLVLAGVAAAFLPAFDPASRLATAAPFSGFTLMLVRAVSALAAALVPVTAAAFFLPGPGWLPAALLLPCLALSVLALAAATVAGPRAAVLIAGTLWTAPELLLAAARHPLLIVQPGAQAACAFVLCSCALLLLARRDHFELEWTR
jgi:hypothetical protein